MTATPITVEHDPSFDPRAWPEKAPDTGVLFADPAHFDVVYVINAFMAGQIGQVDRALARRQWQALVAVYDQLGFDTHVLPAVPDLPDLCFIANQSFPAHNLQGKPRVVLSNMTAPQRRPEVPVVARWFEEHGYDLLTIPDEEVHFEGMGDAMWHPGRRVVYGGHGWRTHHTAYVRRTGFVDAPVVTLQLCDSRFYHLDTCLSPLDEHTALAVREAFTPTAWAMLERCFPRLLRCPLDEAVDALACNGHCPDQRHVIVEVAAPKTAAIVADAGFEVIAVDTSEFRKSGGSVQCLKLMLP